MLRLLDNQIRPARPGLLRVCAHLPSGDDLTGLRILLVADLLTRAAGLRRLQVLTAVASDDDDTRTLAGTASALGIHPPYARTDADPATAEKALGGPVDVHLTSGLGPMTAYPGLTAVVGAATGPSGDDPLALRLVLLSVPWSEPADLTQDALAQAADTLDGWRRQVAGWARSPSRPVPAPLAEQIGAAVDGLDTGWLLALLRGQAADEPLPPGVRFETFVYVDRLLALELPRDIGRDP